MNNTSTPPMIDDADILEIENLKVVFPSGKKTLPAVGGVSLNLKKGCILGLVGESGSGKSVTSLSVLRLNSRNKTTGSIRFRRKDGSVMDILTAREKDMETLRGSEIAMIFQEPGSALNPVLRVGKQLEKVIRLHDKVLDGKGRKARALELLKTVGFPDPERIHHMFPHELSGGMKQRAVIAMALSSSPTLILADEPTTALDATIQEEILELLTTLVKENGVSMILISHDFGVISRMTDSIAIMYDGKIMEEGLKDEILSNPIHPYTRKLIDMARHMGESIESPVMDNPSWSAPDPSLCPFYEYCHTDGRTCREWTPNYIHISRTHRVSCMNLRRDDNE